MAQTNLDVYQVPSESRKIDKIASSGVARPGVNWITFEMVIWLLAASTSASTSD
ncbi:MAG TPA: hypothetical protein VGJ20_23315 [Xanthobacteraceae bacterium]